MGIFKTINNKTKIYNNKEETATMVIRGTIQFVTIIHNYYRTTLQKNAFLT